MIGDVNFSIVLSSICSSVSDSIVPLVPINDSVQYTLPVSHSWTNITLLVENQYGTLTHTVDINQTGMTIYERSLIDSFTEVCVTVLPSFTINSKMMQFIV